MSAFSRKTLGSPPLVVGHRGGQGEGWPTENTLDAFAQAVSEGARAIELDVRVCAGGDVVVFHDADLTRLTAGKDTRKVAQVPLRELVRIPLAGDRRVATLAEVLTWAQDRVAVNVELKRDVPDIIALARAAARAIREGRADVLISSFEPQLLDAMRALIPRVPRAFLIMPRQRPKASPAGIAAVHLERQEATPAAISAHHAANQSVGVWTVNDAAEAKELALLGVDWIITDGPGRIATALHSAPAS